MCIEGYAWPCGRANLALGKAYLGGIPSLCRHVKVCALITYRSGCVKRQLLTHAPAKWLVRSWCGVALTRLVPTRNYANVFAKLTRVHLLHQCVCMPACKSCVLS
jgi:hypothetical protein